MEIYILVLSYLLGSIPFALLIGKVFYKTDIREHGSGNLGGTNAFRVLGKKAGFSVTIGDILKGTLAASLPALLSVDMHPIVAGLPAVLGHLLPVFAGFKGGKAVATSAGIFIFAAPLSFVIGLVFFLISLKISKYVSLSSIVSIVSISSFSAFTNDNILFIFSTFLSLLIIYKHKNNLIRIYKKSEPKVSWL